MSCPHCDANLVHDVNLARQPFASTLQCDCGYSEATTAHENLASALRAIREYWATVVD